MHSVLIFNSIVNRHVAHKAPVVCRRMTTSTPGTWMDNPSQLNVLVYPHSKLAEKSVDLTPDELRPLLTSGVIPRLFDLMYQNDGVGIAAPQVGVNKRFLLINRNGRDDKSSALVFLNPKIVSKSDGTAKLREACISLPDIEARVERHQMVEVRAVVFNQKQLLRTVDVFTSSSLSLFKKDVSDCFEEQTVQLVGKTAQIFQHELDHLDGVLFTDRMYLMTDKKSVRPKLAQLQRAAAMA